MFGGKIAYSISIQNMGLEAQTSTCQYIVIQFSPIFIILVDYAQLIHGFGY